MNCKFCQKAAAKYSCPRCNCSYCSLPCYQCSAHLECSESFYKDWVQTDMSSKGPTDKETMRKTYDMLLKMQKEEQEEEERLDSDDDDDDLAERLEGVDLDDADQVWERLTPQERAEFQTMCSTGAIEKIVPPYAPWWDEQGENTKVQLIQEVVPDQVSAEIELDKASTKFDFSNVTTRPIYDPTSIASLGSLIGNKAPSPLVKFSLLNLIYAYAYGMKYFSGFEPEKAVEFVQMCFDISTNLNSGHNFESADMAVESAASAANQNGEISMGIATCREVKKDVLKIVRGPSKTSAPKNAYILTALSHLKQIMSHCLEQLQCENKKTKSKKLKSDDATAPPWQTEIFSGKVSRFLEPNKVKLAQKKIDFYLSWASECYAEYELFYQ